MIYWHIKALIQSQKACKSTDCKTSNTVQCQNTTNNRMELSAVLFALKALKEPCHITLQSDSKYVLDSLSKGWVYGWQKKGWKKSDGKPALNVDLWQQLLEEIKKHELDYVWIKGHAGHPENERCDKLAVEYYRNLQG